MPKKAGIPSKPSKPKSPDDLESNRSNSPGLLWRLICFVLWFLGLIGRLLAIAALGYCCFAGAQSGTADGSESPEPTQIEHAGWPWVYSISEVTNVQAIQNGDGEQPVRRIYDVIFTSEPALAANVGVFGVVVILMLFASKLFDRFNSFLTLIVFIFCFGAVGYVAYRGSILEARDRLEVNKKILALPGSIASTEYRYSSAMDVAVDRIQSVVHRDDLSKIPSREYIYLCRVQDLDAASTEEVCSLNLLKELTLVNCDVSDAAIQHLASALRLRKLIFDGCNVTSESILPLRSLKRLKDIQIKDSLTIDVAKP